MSDRLKNLLYAAFAGGARVLTLALLSIFPWWYAGASWVSQLPLVYASCSLALLTSIAVVLAPERAGRPSALVWGLVGLSLLAFLQSFSLPSVLVPWLSGSSHFEMVVQRGEGQAESPKTTEYERHAISIDPVQTLASLSVLAAAGIVLWASAVLFSSKEWALALLGTIVIGGTANAFVGLMQAVAWNKWTLLAMPTSTYFSTFVLRNSAPQYYSIAIGAALGLLSFSYRRVRSKRRKEYRFTYASTSIVSRLRNRLEDTLSDLDALSLSAFACIAICMFATFASMSRGGVLASMGAWIVTFSLAFRGKGHSARAMIGLLLLFSLVAIGMVAFELDVGLAKRMDSLNEAAYEGDDGRIVVWGYALNSLSWFGLFGAGHGCFHLALLPFHTGLPSVWFYHAESIPMELLCDFGIVGVVVAVAALVAIGRKMWLLDWLQGEKLLQLAFVYSTTAIGLQSFVDFSLILPGVFLPFATLVGAYLGRLERTSTGRKKSRGRGNEKEVESTVSEEDIRLKERNKSSKGYGRRLVLHGLVASTLVVLSSAGWSSLAGYARSESIERPLNKAMSNAERLEWNGLDWRELVDASNDNAMRYPWHPSAILIAARASQFGWRMHSIEQWKWTAEFDAAQKWRWTDPAKVSSAIRLAKSGSSNSSEIDILSKAASEDEVGMELAQNANAYYADLAKLSHFDSRASVGMLLTDCDWLDFAGKARALKSIGTLCGNNPRVLMNAGLVAVNEGDAQLGISLVSRAVAIDASLLISALPILISELAPDSLEGILPKDAAELAVALQSIPPSENRAKLEAYYLPRILEKLDLVEVASIEGWLALARVASESSVVDRETHFLRRAAALAPLRADLKGLLARSLAKAGRTREAIDEADRCVRLEPQNPIYQALLKELRSQLDQ